MVYNLLYYQVVTQVSIGLTGAERAKAYSSCNNGQIENLSDALALINETLGQTELYMEDDEASTSHNAQVNLIALEQQVCLFFLCIKFYFILIFVVLGSKIMPSFFTYCRLITTSSL